MEKLVVEEYLKKEGKGEQFIKLVRKMFKDYNIKEEKCIEILNIIYR